MRVKKTNAHLWLLEPLEDRADFVRRRMFGCEAAYVGGRLCLVLADQEEPWNGVLVPTEREHHAALRGDHPELREHPVLGKWLFIAETHTRFETVAQEVVKRVLRGDPLIGVEPGSRAKRRRVRRIRVAGRA